MDSNALTDLFNSVEPPSGTDRRLWSKASSDLASDNVAAHALLEVLPSLEDPQRYLRLVLTSASVVDTIQDRRTVTLGFRDLLGHARGNVDDLEVLTLDDEFKTLVDLGEVAAAIQFGMTKLYPDLKVAGPFASAPTIHLTDPRIRMFLSGQTDLIGDRVLARIAKHVSRDTCSACHGAVARARSRS